MGGGGGESRRTILGTNALMDPNWEEGRLPRRLVYLFCDLYENYFNDDILKFAMRHVEDKFGPKLRQN